MKLGPLMGLGAAVTSTPETKSPTNSIGNKINKVITTMVIRLLDDPT